MMKTPKPKKAKASAELKNILKSQGPMLSSQVARNFESTGTKADAARQRTSRLPLDTAALKGISFPKGARFIYHKDDIGTYRYFEALRKTIRENSQPLTSALNAINARDGVMSMQQFRRFSLYYQYYQPCVTTRRYGRS